MNDAQTPFNASAQPTDCDMRQRARAEPAAAPRAAICDAGGPDSRLRLARQVPQALFRRGNLVAAEPSAREVDHIDLREALALDDFELA
jgi:hypothetical protein